MTTYTKSLIMLSVFGAIYLFAALYMSVDTKLALQKKVPFEGGEFGPITTTKSNQVVEIKITQHLMPFDKWTWISADVYSDEEGYLFSFSDEYWREKGYDSDGYWEEHNNTTEFTITLKDPGNYYLEFELGSNVPKKKRKGVFVSATFENGSALLFLWGGILCFIVVAIMIWIKEG